MQTYIKWISDGLIINKTDSGYSVFTTSTGHFTVSDIFELTADKFEEMEVLHRQKETEHNNLISLMFSELF